MADPGERVAEMSAAGSDLNVIVARPGLGEISTYALFPLAAALFYAIYQLVTRSLTNKGERARTTFAWTLATGRSSRPRSRSIRGSRSPPRRGCS